MMRNLILLVLLLFAISAQARSVGIRGKLLLPDGAPVLSANVQFVIQIRTTGSENCLMYQETQTHDLSQSGGLFSIAVGDGTATSINTEPYTLSDVFRNGRTLVFPAGKCTTGSSVTLAPDASRSLAVSFNDGNFPGWEPLPVQVLRAVPYASEALTLTGHEATNFFRVVDGSNVPQIMGAWSIASYDKLTGLIAGTENLDGNAAGFTGTLLGDVTGNQGATLVSRIQGRSVSSNSPSMNQILKWNGSEWAPATDENTVGGPPSGAAGGDLSGSYPAPTVARLLGRGLSSTAPSGGQTLTYDGTQWAPATLNIFSLKAADGVTGQFPTNCTASQTLVFNSPLGRFECAEIRDGLANLLWNRVDLTSQYWHPGRIGLGREPSGLNSQVVIGPAVSGGVSFPSEALVHGIGRDSNSASFVLDAHSTSSSNWAEAVLRRARGTATAPGALQTGDTIGQIRWQGYNGTDFQDAAWLKVFSTGTWGPSAGGTRLVFGTRGADGASPQPRMMIAPNGNIEIGDVDPTPNLERLSVRGNLTAHGSLRSSTGVLVADSYGAAPTLLLRQAQGSSVSPGTTSALEVTGKVSAHSYVGGADYAETSKILMQASETQTATGRGGFMTFWTTVTGTTNSAERMRIQSNGNIGIGTTAPSERVHVVGNLRVQGSTDCTLGNGAGGTLCSSDARLKKHIQLIDRPLEKILRLRGVEFEWNEKSMSEGKKDIGVIAQDVEEVFPTVVLEDASTGYKKVDYAVIVAPLIEAVKELATRVNSILSQFEGTSDRVSILEAQFREAEARAVLAEGEVRSLKAWACKKDREAPFCRE